MPKDFVWGRTVGHLKVTLLLLQTAAFIGALAVRHYSSRGEPSPLCGSVEVLHGYAVPLFSGFVAEFFHLLIFGTLIQQRRKLFQNNIHLGFKIF